MFKYLNIIYWLRLFRQDVIYFILGTFYIMTTQGPLIQLAAIGKQDDALIGNPQTSFFVSVYKRHTNFAMEQRRLYFHGNADFGKKVYFKLDRYGDLVQDLFINIELPSLNADPTSNPDYEVTYSNYIGLSIIKNVYVEIGGKKIDEHYGQWLYIWNELTLPEDKRYGYKQMVGGFDNNSFTFSTNPGPYQLQIPLMFWFNKSPGLALPLIALQRQDVYIYVEFRKFDECWMSNNGNQPGLGTHDSSKMVETSIQNPIVYAEYIYLDDAERRVFAKKDQFYLIEQLQVNSINLIDQYTIFEMDLNHPVKELIWVIQKPGSLENNEYFNFSNGLPNQLGNFMIDAKIQFDGTDRMDYRDSEYFRIIVPYQRHTRTPDNYIYCYSFALFPEKNQPSGSANFSRLDSATLHLRINKAEEEPLFTLYAINYNILKIANGFGGILFEN